MLEENRRDAGLVRAIGVRGLTTSTINTMVGAGIFVTPGALAACMGRSAPVAIILCAIAMGAVTIGRFQSTAPTTSCDGS